MIRSLDPRRSIIPVKLIFVMFANIKWAVRFLLILASLVRPSKTTTTPSKSLNKGTLVSYAYSETSDIHKENFLYFLKHGIPSSSKSDVTVIVIMNGDHSIPESKLNSFFHDIPPETNSQRFVHIIERPNTCFDFGAWGAAIDYAHSNNLFFDYYLFLNASVRGPFISPAISDKFDNNNYPTLFTNHINSKVKLVGTTFNCHTGRDGWHLQSMALATDRLGLMGVMMDYLSTEADTCYANKVDAIYGAEIPLSRAMIESGYGLYSLSSLFEGAEITSDENVIRRIEFLCKAVRPLTTLELGDVNHSDDVLVSPFEVVFYKTNIPSSKFNSVMGKMYADRDDHDSTDDRHNYDDSNRKHSNKSIYDHGNSRQDQQDCKIAFCFSGAARSFVQEKVHSSIATNLISFLSGSRCKPYLFFYLDSPKTEIEGQEIDRILSEVFRPVYSVVEIRFHNPDSFPTPSSNGCTSNLPTIVPGNYQQFKKLKLVYDFAVDYSEGRNIEFKWFVRVRPDMAWIRPVVDISKFPGDRIIVPQNNFFPMNDQFAIIPEAYASVYFTTVDALFVCSDYSHFPPEHSPEYVMWKHLVNDNNVRIQFYDFHVVIARDAEVGGRCGSLWKTFNILCQVMGAFDRIDDSHICVDVYNAWIGEKCRNVFDGLVSSESVEDVIQLGEDTLVLMESGGEDWWKAWLRKYAAEGGVKVIENGVGYYFGRQHNNKVDGGFFPLILTEHSSLKSGHIYTGFVLSDVLIEDIETAFKCTAAEVLVENDNENNKNGDGDSCGLHHVLGMLYYASARPYNCLSPFINCGEEIMDEYKTNELPKRLREIQQKTYGEEKV